MRVASETVNRIQPQGLRAGQMMASRSIVEPGRWVHAFAEGDDQTLCGLDLGPLHVDRFANLEFEHVNRYLWCRACGRLVEPETFA